MMLFGSSTNGDIMLDQLKELQIEKYTYDPTNGSPNGWNQWAVKIKIKGIWFKANFDSEESADAFINIAYLTDISVN